MRVILAQGHANLLCIVPILSDVSEETNYEDALMQYKGRIYFVRIRCGMGRLRTASFLLWSLEPITTTDLHGEREYGNDNFVLVEFREKRVDNNCPSLSLIFLIGDNNSYITHELSITNPRMYKLVIREFSMLWNLFLKF